MPSLVICSSNAETNPCLSHVSETLSQDFWHTANVQTECEMWVLLQRRTELPVSTAKSQNDFSTTEKLLAHTWTCVSCPKCCLCLSSILAAYRRWYKLKFGGWSQDCADFFFVSVCVCLLLCDEQTHHHHSNISGSLSNCELTVGGAVIHRISASLCLACSARVRSIAGIFFITDRFCCSWSSSGKKQLFVTRRVFDEPWKEGSSDPPLTLFHISYKTW